MNMYRKASAGSRPSPSNEQKTFSLSAARAGLKSRGSSPRPSAGSTGGGGTAFQSRCAARSRPWRRFRGGGSGSGTSAIAVSTIRVTRSALGATCRKTDIVPVPSFMVARRMDSASSPSAHAIAIPPGTMRSTVRCGAASPLSGMSANASALRARQALARHEREQQNLGRPGPRAPAPFRTTRMPTAWPSMNFFSSRLGGVTKFWSVDADIRAARIESAVQKADVPIRRACVLCACRCVQSTHPG